jgi:Ig-fold domain
VSESSVSAPARYKAVFDVEVSTPSVAPFVWLDAEAVKGRFSDNGFFLHSATKIVQFFSLEDITATELQSNLNVTSLTNNWLDR